MNGKRFVSKRSNPLTLSLVEGCVVQRRVARFAIATSRSAKRVGSGSR